jgi:hypothetical protein
MKKWHRAGMRIGCNIYATGRLLTGGPRPLWRHWTAKQNLSRSFLVVSVWLGFSGAATRTTHRAHDPFMYVWYGCTLIRRTYCIRQQNHATRRTHLLFLSSSPSRSRHQLQRLQEEQYCSGMRLRGSQALRVRVAVAGLCLAFVAHCVVDSRIIEATTPQSPS